MKSRKISFLILMVLLISILTSSVTYAFVMSKSWSVPLSGSLNLYYSMNSNFTTESKNSLSYANTTWNNAVSKINVYRLSADNSSTDFSNNGNNEVFKKDLGSDYLALTQTYFSLGKCVEFDIAWNNNSAFQWSNSGESGKYDVQNVAAHEIGHVLYAGDVYSPLDVQPVYESEYQDVTMYGFVSTGETKKRSLHQDDIDGFETTY